MRNRERGPLWTMSGTSSGRLAADAGDRGRGAPVGRGERAGGGRAARRGAGRRRDRADPRIPGAHAAGHGPGAARGGGAVRLPARDSSLLERYFVLVPPL